VKLIIAFAAKRVPIVPPATTAYPWFLGESIDDKTHFSCFVFSSLEEEKCRTLKVFGMVLPLALKFVRAFDVASLKNRDDEEESIII